ncbi:MAG: adenylate/guanylate cyclase domain-containing protein [Pseudomonadota bacterium]
MQQTSRWSPQMVSEWLLREGRFQPDLEAIVCALGKTLVSLNAPVARLRLSVRTLHPLIAAYSVIWERGKDQARVNKAAHGLEGSSAYIGSPIEFISRTGMPFRKRLDETLSADDHEILHELQAAGVTDYVGLPLRFSKGRNANLILNSQEAGGFSDLDVEGFEVVAETLAPIVEAHNATKISGAIADAYLGPRTGRLVLDGRITRGDIQKINAAIFVSDIRDWTGLNNRMCADEALSHANRYFELIAHAVEDNDGEVLKLIGDGVLAIFPTSAETETAEAACANALKAARQALQLASPASDDGADPLRFGIALHFGEVLYGNVGSASRLDFTVLGQAVNIAARIEGLCRDLDEALLFSPDFASHLDARSRLVARQSLKGHPQEMEILTVA